MAFTMPRTGEMRHRIELQNRTEAFTGTDDLQSDYVVIATVWARMRAIAGGLSIDGVQETERITHRFDIRHRTDQPSWNYVETDGRRFVVRAVRDPEERKRFLEIDAEEVAYGV